MILICGIPSEPPVARLIERLSERDAPYVVADQRDVLSTEIWHRVSAAGHEGRLDLGEQSWDLGSVTAVYCRMMDPQQLPAVRSTAPGGARRLHARDVYDRLVRFLEITDALVVNRYSAMASNGSKPFQAQQIRRQGFEVPETLVTNCPALVEEFVGRFEQVIYKSISGTRSIVRAFGARDSARLAHIRWCPTQFQERVVGRNIRVHVVGDRVFAVAIDTEAVDYRYAARDDMGVEMAAVLLDNDCAARCVALARSCGLAFAGIDLIESRDGRMYCLEVNPSPGYSYYEERANVPISAALAEELMSTHERG